MQLLPPCGHPILGKDNLWDTISSEVVRLLDQREIKYSSVDLVRFRWVEEKEDIEDDEDGEGVEDVDVNAMVAAYENVVTTPITIWVGVLPGTLTGEVAFQSSEDILASIMEHGISDVHVAYRESVVQDFKGPKLFAPVSDINHLKVVIDPVTTALSLPIAGLKTLHNEGTLGFYFKWDNDYYAVTARHVLFQEHEGNHKYVYKKAVPKKEVVLMGTRAFSDLLTSTQGRTGTLNTTVGVLEKRIAASTRRLQGGGSDAAEAARELTKYQGELESTRTAIEELKKFFQEIKKYWSKPRERVIGYVTWAPPISFSTGPNGYTVDVCVVKLDKEKFLDNFGGNVLDLGTCRSVSLKASKPIVHVPGPEINATRFTELMYPRVDAPSDFEYPSGRLLPFRGILSAEKIREASDKEQN